MRLLLDTHVWLWMRLSPRRLSAKARRTLEDGRNELLLSSVSAAELALKVAAGRLRLPSPVGEFVAAGLERSATRGLPLTVAHAVALGDVPALHGDPFDRLLVAQARVERVPLMTADERMSAYDVRVVPAT